MKSTEISNIKHENVCAVQCRYCAYPTPGATYRTASSVAAPQAYEIKSCRDALCTGFTGFTSRNSPPANRGTTVPKHVIIANNYFQLPGICYERFAAVIQKKSDNNLELYESGHL
jgi:hypothetical protein